MRIIAPDHIRHATLSCATAQPDWPARALASGYRGDELRTSGAAGQVIRASWPSARTLSAVALCRHNLSPGGTLRLQLYSDAAWTTQVYDSGTAPALIGSDPGTVDAPADPGWRSLKNTARWFAPVAGVRALQITLDDPANPHGHLAAQRLIAGTYAELQNPDWGHALHWDDPTEQARTLGGSLVARYMGERTRRFQFTFSLLDAPARNYLADLYRAQGKGGELFISMWPGEGGRIEREHQAWARISDASGLERPLLHYYTTELEFSEC